jgi:hypothetical protein
MIKEHYVYVDWTLEEVPRPFYVGKGNKRRVGRKTPRNKLHENITNKHGIDRRIEYVTEDEAEALAKECELIAKYKTFYHDPDGWGANFTLGGDGVSGSTWNHSDEAKEKLRQAHQGKKKTAATKKKMKKAAKKRAKDPAWKEKMREVARRRWQDPEYREKMRNARLGQKRSEEQLDRMRVAQQKAWADESRRAKHSRRQKEVLNNESTRKKISDAIKEKWQDPEYRKKMYEARHGKEND